MSVRYVDTPSRPQAQPIILPPPARKPISPLLIWIIAGIVIIIILLIFGVASTKVTATSITVPQTQEPMYNLETLVNLDPTGVCCQLPSSVNVTTRYVYLASTNRTYSLTPSNVAVVCQGLTGQALKDCQNEVADSSGALKVVAHKGINVYYTFSLGPAPATVCQSFQTCPVV